jgi:hypothetical protein
MTRLIVRTVVLVPLIVLTACGGGGSTQPTAVTQPMPPSRPINGETFEVAGVVTDERGTPMAGATVTMGLWSAGFPHWPSVLTDATGSYKVNFTATPSGSGFVARAQVVAEGYEEYWRSLRSAGGTTFIENFRLDRIIRVIAGNSIVLAVPPDVGECRGWVAEVCPIVRVTVPSQGHLTIEVDPIGQSAELPPVEVCCVDGNERYGNPITVPISSERELDVKVGLRRGVTTTLSFRLKTSFDP